MSKKREDTHRFESSDRAEVVAAFEADRTTMRAKGYVPVEERWSEPNEGRRSHKWIGIAGPAALLGSMAAEEGRAQQTFHRLEVRYAPIERAAKSQGGLLDITVTENGRCPTCDLPTMQMPRPPYERYCNECQTEFPA